MKAPNEPRGPIGKGRGARRAGFTDSATGGSQHSQRGAAQPGFLLNGNTQTFRSATPASRGLTVCVKTRNKSTAFVTRTDKLLRLLKIKLMSIKNGS